MDEYAIKGHISGDSEGKLVYLYSNFINSEGKGKSIPIASTTIENGIFEFKGKLAHPQLLTIKLTSNALNTDVKGPVFQPVIPVFVGSGSIEISAVLGRIPNEFELLTKSYSYKNIKIKGAPHHDLYLSFYKAKQKFDEEKNKEIKRYLIYLNPKKGDAKQPISKGVEILKNVEQVENRYKDYIKQFIEKNKESVVAARIAFDKFSYFSVAEIDELISIFPKSIIASPVGELLLEKAAEVKKTAVGALYTDCIVESTNGKAVKLSSILGKGKYVMLQFWASWCQSCIADLPHLMKTYSLYASEGFEILGVSVDANREDWLRATADYKMSWPQVVSTNGMKGCLPRQYNFSSVPAYILLDPEGYIVSRNMKGLWMNKKLIELFGDKHL